MVTIIDYGAGNIGSIVNMIRKVGGIATVSSNEEEIATAKKLILPGVGSFDFGMKQLHNSGLINVLNQRVLIDKIPILGICLGVQLFTLGSEEGKLRGLGWFDAETVKFDFNNNKELKIPHMGWNNVKIIKDSKIFIDMYDNPRFYFVHSYHLRCKTPHDISTETHYGYPFVSGLEKDNIIGFQFHPEKSHKFGMKIIENFLKYY